MDESKNKIFVEQMAFFKSGNSGCIFSALAAKDPAKYQWHQIEIKHILPSILNEQIKSYIRNSDVSTLSMIFPSVKTIEDLLELMNILERCELIITEKAYYKNFLCYAFRVKIGNSLSWVTGFGPFDFFPKTRQTPYTEITCRVKPKPEYEAEVKKSPDNTLHLAHMDMKGISPEKFKALWQASLSNTEKKLGSKPDFLSAAKTSFIIPERFIEYDYR